MIMGLSARIYGSSTNITQAEMSNPNAPGNREEITRKVLEATGRVDQFGQTKDIDRVSVEYADVIPGSNGEKEAVVIVNLSPKNTIVAVYEKIGNQYRYAGEVGYFYDVQGVQEVQIGDLGRSMIVLRELVDQHVGAFERNTFVRGYLWKPEDENFDMVLNLSENIDAHWNRAWDEENQTREHLSRWERIGQKSDLQYEKGQKPVVHVTRSQILSASDDRAAKNIPEEETYQVVSSRTVNEEYYWSPKWNRFILSERQEKATGQEVAVLEDISASPYALLGTEIEKYKIMYPNGTVDIVNKDSLTEAV